MEARPDFSSDGRGNLLLISGVLLVLGFVVLSTTLVQLHSLEGSTARTQRGGLVDQLDVLMLDLQEGLYDSLLTGQTNVTDFEAVMRNLERGLVESAARSGLYVALVPTTEDPDVWRRPDRCMGYNVESTDRGVVVGWTVDDLEETIAGVVYKVHATDGRQSLQFYYYALMERCADTKITTVYAAFSPHLGSVSDPLAMKTVGDATGFLEQRDTSVKVLVVFHPTIRSETIVIQGNWNNQQNIHAIDGQYTTMSSNLASLLTQGNHFRFQIEPPPLMKPTDTLPNVTLDVTGYKALPWSLLQPQSMYLRIYPQGSLVPTVTREIPFPVGAANVATHQAVIPELVPLRGHWTYADLSTSLWELTVMGTHQPSQHWNIDAFLMTGGMEMSPFRSDTVFDWQPIPASYGGHVVEMRYRVTDERTVGEAFVLALLDKSTGSWRNVTSISYTGGGWVDVAVPATDIDASPDSWLKAQFRLADTRTDDYFDPEDRDRLEVEYLRVTSELL